MEGILPREAGPVPARGAHLRLWFRASGPAMIAGVVVGMILGSLAYAALPNERDPLPRISLSAVSYQVSSCHVGPGQDTRYYRAFLVNFTLVNTGPGDGFALMQLHAGSDPLVTQFFVPRRSEVMNTRSITGRCDSDYLREPSVLLVAYFAAGRTTSLSDVMFHPGCTETLPYLQTYAFSFTLVNTDDADGHATLGFKVWWSEFGQRQYLVHAHTQAPETAVLANERGLPVGIVFSSYDECISAIPWQGWAVEILAYQRA